MSSWCIASEDNVHGRHQKGLSLWTRVHKLYEQAQADNPEELSERNVDMIKGRWKRLNENGNKWLAACKEAYSRKRSGMSQADVEKEAHAIYNETCGCRFQDLVVFNEVMYEVSNEESGGSSKRSRTSEHGDYSAPSNPETPTSDCSTIPRPIGRDKAKRKGKGKISESSSNNEVVAEIRALRLTKDNEVEAMTKLHEARVDLELKKEQRKAIKMKEVMLNTLLAKDNLSPEDEEMKRRLIEIVFRQSM
ncbi:uncharacterized protein LOC131022888 [Salvia miltiorrhiza]|uniref:uncharacterized protein LOC131022888 n=1 Tax=Salvia miltiorrhiza TaxID=226208 RepID=UPI0025AB61B4|nr:uncharacterized protein LOC131022888 [Salvia miltiorrhiza]